MNETVRQRFDFIVKHVELEAKLIDDLLDLTRVTNGKLLLEQKPVSVRSVIEEALVALTGYGMDRDIENEKKGGFITHLTKPIHIESLENALCQF